MRKGAAVRIDSHHHIWDLKAVSYPWLEARGQRRFFGDPTPIQRDYLIDEFRATAAGHGVEASVHVQVGAEDPLAETRWVDGVAAANPGWPAAQVAFADLTRPDLDRQLETLGALPSVRGIRQIVGRSPAEDSATGTNRLLGHPRFLAGLRMIAAAGLSFDLQLLPELMADSARVFGQVPELPVVICHAGSPHDRTPDGLRFWSRELGRLSILPNLHCKISGLGMFEPDWNRESIRPIVETCLEQFGPDRCMFGSNFPVDSLSSEYGELIDVISVLIPDSAHSRVFGRTASRFYRLE